jgi:hypothetical protein
MWVGAATVATAALVALAIGARRPAAVAARPALAAS